MADIAINPVDRRVQFTGNTGLGPFAFTFNILADADIVAYKNTTLLTLTTDYTVTTNVNGTGSITLTGSGNGTALIASDVLTIIGGRELSRTTDFVTAGDLLASSLNEQLDSQVIMAQQLDEKMTRALKVNPGDEFTSLELPLKDSRKGKYLAFNATTGDPEAGASSDDVATLAAITDDIATLADIEDGTDATDAIQTVAGISANVTTVAGISSNVTAVAADATDIGTVATDLAGSDTIGTVAGSIANVNTTAGSISNVNTAAGSISNINTVAGSIANVNTTAANITDVNTFAVRYRIGATDPVTSLDAGDLFFNTTSSQLKVYSGSAWVIIQADTDVLAAISSNDTTAGYLNGKLVSGTNVTLTENNDGGNETLTISAATELSGDTTPQLGGVLDTNGNNIEFGDSTGTEVERLKFGADDDMEMYHDGSNGYVVNNAGNLILDDRGGGGVTIKYNTETMANFAPDGAVTLYYDNSAKIATSSTGVSVTGTALATTDTDTTNSGNVTLDFGANQNFVLTLTGNVTLDNPTTEQVGQSGFIVFIQDATGGRTVSLGTDYETAGGAGLTLSTAASTTDIVPYVVAASGRILLGTPQLAFA